MPRLSKSLIDAAPLPAAGKRAFLWDSEVKGFGLQVTAGGTRTYVLQYRMHGHTRRLAIGRHGSPWVPDKARAEARRLLSLVADGLDPLEEKILSRSPTDVEELALLYLELGPSLKPNKRASSWATDRSNIVRHIVPLLGHRPLAGLTSDEVARFQMHVVEGRSARIENTKARGKAVVEGGPGAASRALAVLAAMLEFGVKRGLLRSNPARGVPIVKLDPRKRFLSPDEVRRLAVTLAEMETFRGLTRDVATIIRLLLLTGCRKSEIVGLNWSEIDFHHAVIRLPAGRSKTGSREIPLAPCTVSLLKAVPLTDPVFVFPARGGGRPMGSLQHCWERVRARAGLVDVRLHDLRHSFASVGAANGLTLLVIGEMLGHKDLRSTQRYAHLADSPVRHGVDVTAAHVARNLGLRE